jgi:hypothetical protein
MTEFIWRIRTLALLAGVACASGPSIKPQTVKQSDLLSPPAAAFFCRPKPLPSRAPPSAQLFEFEDRTLLVNDRLMSVVYDSVGVPLLFVMTGTEKKDGSQAVSFGLSASFPTGEAGTGFYFARPVGNDNPMEASPTPMAPEMVTEAKNLAVWLWNHRCKNASMKPVNHEGTKN